MVRVPSCLVMLFPMSAQNQGEDDHVLGFRCPAMHHDCFGDDQILLELVELVNGARHGTDIPFGTPMTIKNNPSKMYLR